MHMHMHMSENHSVASDCPRYHKYIFAPPTCYRGADRHHNTHLPTDQVAIKYWRMSTDASWVDCLKRMLADE